jgi:hypothetical protein
MSNCSLWLEHTEWVIPEGSHHQNDFQKGDFDLRRLFGEGGFPLLCSTRAFQRRDVIPGRLQRDAYPVEVLSCCRRDAVRLIESRCSRLR